MDTFRLFSATHALVVVGFAAVVTSLVVLRRRARDERRAAAVDRTVATAAVVVAVLVNGWPLLPRHCRIDWSLPLHVCDLTVLCVPFAVATARRLPRTMVHFWGIGLSTQGFVTPDLQDGPAKMGFWMFWLSHYAVVGGALYDLFGRGYRPRWRDYFVAFAASLLYVAVILPFDILFSVNYGYIGPAAPGQPSIVDALGPWPLRVPIIVGLSLAGMALLMVPWEIARRRGKRPETA